MQSIIGATEIRRPMDLVLFSTEMPIFPMVSTCDVSAIFLRIPRSLLVAEGTYSGQEWLVPSGFIMPTIEARKQANGSTRYSAIVR